MNSVFESRVLDISYHWIKSERVQPFVYQELESLLIE